MKKMFLSSSFKDVAELLPHFMEESLEGKTVSFIPTASIPESVTFYVQAGKKALQKLGMIVDEVELTALSPEEITRKLKANDSIYITGGNTFFLLQALRQTGADRLIVEHIKAGKLYIGESAGAMIVSPDITYAKAMDDFKQIESLDYTALKSVDFYPLPHHTNFPFKKSVEKIIAEYQFDLKLCPISNTQAILVSGEDVRIADKKLGEVPFQ
ncbi:Type 1 glutamine amidotransferase-like domain-containing protein [Sulfurospirillum barnesii]|uniref:Peptidase E n=1 Tax=Sulfurospirillum barnesii (strain ATCC 700032 / DSM 10660 / SES-3) TaxID=760154 RepID=I3XU41_SULBS|nr:Type 1 glutamine amidotransferase-like domain-containing protein [Sulfurospirillum barnesii]AFL67465.1 peptidase E [Sulfurospirillum barnesii SES-3]